MRKAATITILPLICFSFLASCNQKQTKEEKQPSMLPTKTKWESADGGLFIETHESDNGGRGCLRINSTYNYFYWQIIEIDGNQIGGRAFFYDLDEAESFIMIIPNYSIASSSSTFECSTIEFQQGKDPYRFSDVSLEKTSNDTYLFNNVIEAQLGKHLTPWYLYEKYDLDFYLNINNLINKTEFVNSKKGDYYNAKLSFESKRAFKITLNGRVSAGFYDIDGLVFFNFITDEIFNLGNDKEITFKLT